MNQLSPIFAALGDPVRLAIVDRLLLDGERSAGQIAQIAPSSPPACSRQLKVLREAGLVAQRTDRQRRLYSARPEAVRQISAWTINHREFWEASLDRLEHAMNKELKADGAPGNHKTFCCVTENRVRLRHAA